MVEVNPEPQMEEEKLSPVKQHLLDDIDVIESQASVDDTEESQSQEAAEEEKSEPDDEDIQEFSKPAKT